MDFPIIWKGIYKPITSISLFNSPEVDIALATICFLALPNSRCSLQGANGKNYEYQTYTKKGDDGVTYIGSAFAY